MDNTKKGLTLVKTEDKEYYVDSQARIQGLYKRYSSLSGNILEICNYVNDEKDGECIRYHYGTYIISFKCSYSKGLKEGEVIWYYESKRIFVKGNYVKDKRDGEWAEYKDKENSKAFLTYFKDGEECDPPSIEVKNARKKI